MHLKKILMSEVSRKTKEREEMHRSVKARMAERRETSANLDNLYFEKTNSLTQLRNK